MPWRAVGIAAEISQPLELHRRRAIVLGDRRLEAAILEHFQRVRVEVGHQIAAGAGIGPAEQRVVEPHFRRERIGRRDPMDRAAHLASVGRVAALGRPIVGAAQLDNLAGIVLHRLAAGDEIGVAQPHLAARRQAIEVLRRVLHKIVALDVELPAERDLPRASRRIVRMVDRVKPLGAVLGVILDHQLQRTQHRHPPRCGSVELVAYRMLEHPDIDHAVGAGDADALRESADRLGRNAAAPEAREGRHARVVPARHTALVDQPLQKPLRHHRIPLATIEDGYKREEGNLQVDALERGIELERQGKYEEALPLLREAVRKDNQSYLAWTYLASTLDGLQKHNEAVTAADHALQLNPKFALAWSAKGAALNHLGDHDGAIEACNQALAIEPNHTYALLNKGLAYYFRGEPVKALTTFDRVLTINPTYVDALVGKAIVFGDAGEPKEMLSILSEALRIDPRNARAWKMKGIAYDMRQVHQEAINAYEESIKIEPSDAETWFYKAEAFAEVQEYQEALDALNQALTISPQYKEARELKSRISAMKTKQVTGAVGDFSLRLGVGVVEGLAKVFVGMVKAIFKDWSKF